ncbi:multiubiquitin domain-containing protein [Bradyrhizobium sp. CCGUVB14]|uniref:multiubiquitin domain-containing protein n=1 Tax=Bradyrhizobium sp. CCGUVB14 TaxID=2949628 RepID=UPI0020B39A13|nr:multiubiquitin domain-containing protein [Bradyrhizobium sp. CCGUVB14]MCP3439793.1 multiubiquitin domain-containing protein [Bradyrhizobium sp. CCGUVB14]
MHDKNFFLYSGADLQFRRGEVDDNTPTGEQLALAAGFKPAQQATVLHFLPDGELEDIRPTETVALTTDEERFVIVESDRSFRFTVDGERFDWPVRLISGGTVRKLGQIPDDRELLLDCEDERDKVIGRHELVDLGRPGVETFKSRKQTWELNVQGVPVISDAPSIVVRTALVDAGFDPNAGWLIFLKVHGQKKRPVTLNDTVDLTEPGIEKLRLTPDHVGNGEAPAPTRAFELLDADEEHLNRLGLRWETIIESDQRRWLLIHNYPVPDGFTTKLVLLALEIPPTYPQAALYGFYAFPPLALASGVGIANTQLRGTIRGQEFHGWSRNRGNVAWNPAKDNVATQLTLVDEAMAKETGQ